MTTYNNIHSNNQDKLKNMSNAGLNIVIENTGEVAPHAEDSGIIAHEFSSNGSNERTNTDVVGNIKSFSSGEEENGKTTHFVSPDYSLSFLIETDKYGNILNIDSFIDMPEEAYEKITKQAWNNKNSNSPINLNEKLWQYSISPVTVTIQGNDGRILEHTTDEKYQITFLDVTESHKTLQDLLFTFLIVGFIMLAVIFAISLYFSNRAIKPIAETWEKQKQFIADASHELKTPLTIIKSNYGLILENRKETVESQMEWLDYIKAGADRMSKLTNDLLALANMDSANSTVRNEPFNISNVITDVVRSMEARATLKSISLSTSIEPDIFVNSDIEKIEQIITILLDNAVKYTNDGGNVDVSLITQKRQLSCSVKNSGNCIAKEDLPRIFDRFYRADTSRTGDNGGHGLGLSIAKAIMDKLGGKIIAESIENESTTFTFTLGL